MYAKNAWNKYSENKQDLISFCEDYKKFITKGKTERRCVEEAILEAEKAGFKNIDSFKSLKTGDKVYATNKGKNFASFIIGEKPLEEGLRVLGAHIDSPRLDLKQNPLYEKFDFALLDTHYYGGIKKYQWVTIPLALYGVVCKKDGTQVKISIGDNEGDPVVGISDLLIHLAGDQMQKNAARVIEGEDLDLTIGSQVIKDGDSIEVVSFVGGG